MAKCPDCGGQGFVHAHLNKGPLPHEFCEVACLVCKGAKVVTPEHLKRINDGKVMRSSRIAAGLTIMQEATRLGITPSRLSAIERGEP